MLRLHSKHYYWNTPEHSGVFLLLFSFLKCGYSLISQWDSKRFPISVHRGLGSDRRIRPKKHHERDQLSLLLPILPVP